MGFLALFDSKAWCSFSCKFAIHDRAVVKTQHFVIFELHIELVFVGFFFLIGIVEDSTRKVEQITMMIKLNNPIK